MQGKLPRLLLITSAWPPAAVAAPPQPPSSSRVKRQAEAFQALGMSVEIFAFTGRTFYNVFAAWTQLRPHLHPGRYDVVHAQDGSDALLAFPKRVPLVVTVATAQWFVVRLLARGADAVVVPSDEIGRQLHTRAGVHVLPPGLDEAARTARLVEVYRSLARA